MRCKVNIKYIKEYCKETGYDIKDFFSECNISYSVVCKIMRGEYVAMQTICKIIVKIGDVTINEITLPTE